jgi:amidohydrolase
MDALFIEEENTFAHASTVPGKMHACGHDGHTTMLLGAARYLAENPDFAGTVHFIFQPAEEAGTGAAAMIADGLFDRFPVDAVYGMHNTPGMPVGQFATRPGPILAGADFWGVTFTGTGGHGGAAPHLATDATVVLGHFLLGVQTILPRNLKPTEARRCPSVMSVAEPTGRRTSCRPASSCAAPRATSARKRRPSSGSACRTSRPRWPPPMAARPS